jgi:hypothetical protein
MTGVRTFAPPLVSFNGCFYFIHLSKINKKFGVLLQYDNKIQGQGPISSSLQQNLINVPQQMINFNKRKRSTINNVMLYTTITFQFQSFTNKHLKNQGNTKLVLYHYNTNPKTLQRLRRTNSVMSEVFKPTCNSIFVWSCQYLNVYMIQNSLVVAPLGRNAEIN